MASSSNAGSRAGGTAATRADADAARQSRNRGADAVDKRRLILDAAVRVFARQGFHSCRVADVADEAGVA